MDAPTNQEHTIRHGKQIAPLTYTMDGAIPICRLDEECGHVAGHDAGHRVVRIARPVLDLETAALLLDELVLLGGNFFLAGSIIDERLRNYIYNFSSIFPAHM